jgi:hypothetical protein
MRGERKQSLEASRLIFLALLSVLAALALIIAGPACGKKVQEGTSPQGVARRTLEEPGVGGPGTVRGYIYADLGSGEEDPWLLPAFEVYLEDPTTRQPVAEAATDVYGAFTFGLQPRGKYRLCWKQEGWQPGCSPGMIRIGHGTTFTGLLGVRPAVGTGPDGRTLGVLSGHVRLADGVPPGFVDPGFGLADTPIVRVPGVNHVGHVNFAGQWVIAGVPAAPGKLSARVGRDTLGLPPTAEAMDLTGRRPVEIVSKNHSPSAPTIVARLGGKSVTGTVAPGAILEVQANGVDPDGDILNVRWAANAGVLSSPRGQKIQWTLPDVPGLYTLYAVTNDGRAGYGQARFAISAGTKGAKETVACSTLPCPGCPPWSGSPQSPFLTFKGNGSSTEVQAYYRAVDPHDQRTTLVDWWKTNGFDASGSGGIRASYLNHNDLGLGRDMHCLKSVGRVACYVTNYGCPDQDPRNADRADAQEPAARGATVAMEHAAVEEQDPKRLIVKFFAFGPDDKRVESADLDLYGLKSLPRLCLNCHGGTYTPKKPEAPTLDEIDMGSSFREFDLETFLYTKNRSFKDLEPTELATFKSLNLMVRDSQPWPAIQELIQGWYAGSGDKPDTSWLPTQWQDASNPAKADLYHTVVATSCRTCHIAFRSSEGSKLIDWSTYPSFQQSRSLIKIYACGSKTKAMPHAIVTYKNFWLSHDPSRSQALGDFKAGDWSPFGVCK